MQVKRLYNNENLGRTYIWFENLLSCINSMMKINLKKTNANQNKNVNQNWMWLKHINTDFKKLTGSTKWGIREKELGGRQNEWG